MKLSEVPQERGMIDGDLTEVCYAVDAKGRYKKATSAGWEPKNIANRQAWEQIDESVMHIITKIRDGQLSPLAYHMALNQMNIGLLANYVGLSRLTVWWHLKPIGFRRMKPRILDRYLELFDFDRVSLNTVPEIDKEERIEND